MSKQLSLPLCSCVHAALINGTFFAQPSHNRFFIPQHDGSYLLSVTLSLAVKMPEPSLYLLSIISSCLSLHCLSPLAYQSVCCSQLSDFLLGSVTLILLLLSSSSSSSLPLPEDPRTPTAAQHQSLQRRPVQSHTRARHTHATCSFIFHLCQSPWSCLRESNPPSNLSLYSYSLFDSRSFLSLFFSPPHCVFGRVSEYNGSLFLSFFF